MCSINVVGLAQLRCANDLRGDVVSAMHHVEMHVAMEALQGIFLK
jgi:hypothetical protein